MFGNELSIDVDRQMSVVPPNCLAIVVSRSTAKPRYAVSGAPSASNRPSAGLLQNQMKRNVHAQISEFTSIDMKTGASIDARLLAQTGVTLDQNTVTQPAL